MKALRFVLVALFVMSVSVGLLSCSGGGGGGEPEVTPPATVKVTGVTLNVSTLSLVEGETSQLTATISPSNAGNKSVTWTSSATSVATVDASGKVTAVGEGTATITVKTADGAKTASCRVTVQKKTVSVTGVTISQTEVTITKGQTVTLTVTITPADATNKNVTWTSDNTSVATVSNGTVTAVGAGTATITATTQDGSKVATCQVTVEPVLVTGVTLNKTELTLMAGETETLTATIEPADADNKNVEWSTSNASVATVSNGTITAVNKGTATITVITEDGAKTATCQVTVNIPVPVTGVSLNKTNLSLVKGTSETLTATVSPDDAANKNVTWTSSNTSVATVNNGVVTAVAVGTATITVTTADGGKTAICQVTVTPVAVTGVTLSRTSLSLERGNTFTLTATINPSNADNKNVTWSSNNTAVATANNGVVTAVAVGTATITVKTEDGGKTATCQVTVSNVSVTGITLDKTSMSLPVGSSKRLTATVAPANADDKSVTWSSSDNSIATVDGNGVVTGNATGSATITVRTNDGGKTATCSVTVTSGLNQGGGNGEFGEDDY